MFYRSSAVEYLLGGFTRINVIMPIIQAVPLLRAADVARSIEWYRSTLGFVGDPFPAAPPHEFAILRHGQVGLMLRRGSPPVHSKPRQYDWDVYLRREGSRFREVFAELSARGIVTRRLERMFYGLAEFEVTDPDGYIICLSQPLEDGVICQRLPPNLTNGDFLTLTMIHVASTPRRRDIPHLGLAGRSGGSG